jgi:hypothetical protein
MTAPKLGDALNNVPLQSSLGITASIAAPGVQVVAQGGYLTGFSLVGAGGTVGSGGTIGFFDTLSGSAGALASNQIATLLNGTVGYTGFNPPIPFQLGLFVSANPGEQYSVFWT